MGCCKNGIFRDSLLSRKFANNKINIYNPKLFYFEGNSVLYVEEETFPLIEYLMKPFLGRQELNQEEIIYNYRLSRARRTIENTFDILSSQ